MRLATAFAALLTLTSVGASSDAPRVPDQYIGQWAGRPESCGSDADLLTLRLSKDRIAYWESEGPILASVSRGARDLALIIELSGEGETWLATAKFELSSDGQQLVDSTTIPGESIVRHRCPTVAAARPN
jgi:hypothetical protein